MNKELEDAINGHLDKFIENHMPKNFNWRPQQKETVIDVLDTYFSEEKKMYIR